MKCFCEHYKNYTIRTCEAPDIPKLMRFIGEHWAKGHILSVSRKLMDWQYYNRRWDRYNFLAGTDDKSGEILGVISYIPTYMYDDNIADIDKYIWLSVWKVRDDYAKTALGLQLLGAVLKLENTKNAGTVGNNQAVEPLYRMMKFKTGILEHYYIANDSYQRYSLLSANADKRNHESSNGVRLRLLEGEDELEVFFDEIKNPETDYPLKTANYFINRYMKHPFYKYNLYGVENNGANSANGNNGVNGANGDNCVNSVNNANAVLLVCRTAQAEGASAVRIVDMHGAVSGMAGAYRAFQALLRQSGAEYIDLYCHGLDGEQITAAGFTRRTAESGVVVPNYYEPYSASNTDIRYAYHTGVGRHYCIFKGDCDQDRPNRIDWDE